MNKEQIKIQMDFWRMGSERTFKTAQGLLKLKRYDHCLFFCHLSLEKIIKGLLIKAIKEAAPKMHDLDRLSFLAKIKLTDEEKEYLRHINQFNISGRYEDYKYQFYKICTKEYTEKWFRISKKLLKCLKEKYPKK